MKPNLLVIGVHEPMNIILMHKNVEKKFDTFELTVLPMTLEVQRGPRA